MGETILVTGGAGYVGSHTAYLLAQRGHKIIILDALTYQQPLRPSWAELIIGNCNDAQLLDTIFTRHSVTAVMHFAASIEVSKSVADPHEFYVNNVVTTLQLLNVMRHHHIPHLIFSSTCAVFGAPVQIPMHEQHPRNPINPYGRTKLTVEYAIEDYARAYNLRYVILRYFNASGAFPEARLSEYHRPETHAIPLLVHAARRKIPFKIYGTTYATPDGTALRDYVHVLDIAQAHVKALDHLIGTGMSETFNLGTGTGHSVLQLIAAAERVLCTSIQVEHHPARSGDVPVLIADASKAQRMLDWQPKCSQLDFIIASTAQAALMTEKDGSSSPPETEAWRSCGTPLIIA